MDMTVSRKLYGSVKPNRRVAKPIKSPTIGGFLLLTLKTY
jgi:hypothetical protein